MGPLEDGTNHSFKIPRYQKFNVDGLMAVQAYNGMSLFQIDSQCFSEYGVIIRD